MNNIFKNRANSLQQKIKDKQSILLSSSSDIVYFTNFQFLVPEEREAFLFITKNSINLIHASFSPVDNFPHINYLEGSYPDQLAAHLNKIIKNEEIKTILIDDKTLLVAELNAIQERFPQNILNIENYQPKIIQDLRNIKEENEINKIKKACNITSKTMKEVKNKLKMGITELEVKKLITILFDKYGVEQLAFPTIVAFGSNSAIPHHQPSNKKLENNMVVLIDMGARVSGYCADMTRTFWFGENPSKKFLEIEKIVKDAYEAAFKKLGSKLNIENETNKTSSKATLASGISNNTNNITLEVKAKDLDNAARTIIANEGYAENFIHTTGHGLGLSIHEQPSLSWSNQTEIKPNMTLTIEPGIYIEGEFGVRYENTILVTSNKAIELTN